MFLSEMQYYFSFRDRRAVKNNLKVILNTDKDLSRYAKEVFRNFGKYLVEFFRMPRKLDAKYISEKVNTEDVKMLKKALEKGRGAIILTAHVGNWELGGVILSLLGYPSVAIALPHKERPVNDLFNAQRESKGITVVPPSMAIRRCIEALKNNKIIAVLADRDFTLHGEELDFLGKKAFIPRGAAIFSCRTGAPLVPTFFVRNADDDGFTLIMEEPIEPPHFAKDGKNEETCMLHLMKQYTALIERKIREYPTQWLMFREFWSR